MYQTLTTNDTNAAIEKHNKRNAKGSTSVGANVTAAVKEGGSLSGVLDGDSDSNKCVSDSPLTTPHIVLPARVLSGMDIVSPAPMPMLIDGGSSTVLIREDVTSSLGLQKRTLPELFQLGSAWGITNRTVKEFVRLRITTDCRTWTSTTLRALVVSELCAPLILGQLFLKNNNIIVDHTKDKLIVSRTQLDLLHINTIRT